MIATFYRYGRLGNRLFTFANLIAFSEMCKVPLLMTAFAEYRKDFPSLDANKYCQYPLSSKAPSLVCSPAVLRVAAKLGIVPTVRFWQAQSVFFDAEDSKDARVAAMIESPLVIFEGWDFRSRTAILQVRDKIVSVFKPRHTVEEEVRKRMSVARESSDIVVGVHVRWEDYRGTDRFLDLHEYVRRMTELRDLLSPQKVSFLVVSPENVPVESLPVNSFRFAGKSAVVDMYSLAECDYVMGPPSTFSMWASYYGAHPLFLLKSGRPINDVSTSHIATP